MTIELNKTYNFTVDNVSFGDIPPERIPTFFQDGRVAAFLLEEQLTHWFPELTRIEGNKDHDHIDRKGRKYDAKGFTKGGLRFMPSSMIGIGRKLDNEVARKKAAGLIYICCDIVEFPKVRVKFIYGKDLIQEYPKCEVKPRHREVLFG